MQARYQIIPFLYDEECLKYRDKFITVKGLDSKLSHICPRHAFTKCFAVFLVFEFIQIPTAASPSELPA